MSELVSAFLASKVVRTLLAILVLVLLCFGLYQGGKYAQRSLTDAINKAQDQLIAQIQQNLQATIDERMNTIQASLNSNMAGIQTNLKAQKDEISKTHDALNNLGDVWLQVEDTRNADGSSSGDSKTTGSASGGSGSHGTSYAKLPAASVQFLKGEAYRGDQCAVRLTSAQQTLVQYQGAFEKYQTAVQDALKAAKLK